MMSPACAPVDCEAGISRLSVSAGPSDRYPELAAKYSSGAGTDLGDRWWALEGFQLHFVSKFELDD
jgi:hypothetical protein